MLEKLLSLIEVTFPIPGRFREKLCYDIADLSRLLTAARGEREGGYLNRPNMLSAYLRYFLPWNLFRLCHLFSLDAGSFARTENPAKANSPAITGNQSILPVLSDGDAITDLGSGPLTLPIALWIAFPELRNIQLEFRCVDKSAATLDAGYKLFRALCAATQSGEHNNNISNSAAGWKIKTIHDSIDAPIRGKPAKLVTAVNVFNEIYPEMQRGSILKSAEKTATLLCKLCADDGSILVVEPGNPQGGAFISALRTALLNKGRYPAAPCTHTGICPLPGISSSPPTAQTRDVKDQANSKNGHAHSTKAKWCHFAFDTETAPAALHALSIEARIPKERATFSFLLAEPQRKPETKRMHTNTATPDIKRMYVTSTALDIKRMHVTSTALDIKRMRVTAATHQIPLPIRIVSDTFPVPFQKGGLGCYGCSERGMILVCGNRTQFNAVQHGSLLTLTLPNKEQRDPKTGALIIPLIDFL